MPRRLRISRQDIEKYGFTVNCPGCRAVNRGQAAQNHSEECRKSILEEIRKLDNDDRIAREKVRFDTVKNKKEERKGGRGTPSYPTGLLYYLII